MRLSIGTVQLGMDYGIAGGKIPAAEEAVRTLEYAIREGITSIDTAEAYGRAEEIVGLMLKKKEMDRSRLYITSKLAPGCLDQVAPENWKAVITEHLDKTLQRLHTDYVDAYLYHSSSYCMRPELMAVLHEMIGTGKIRECGVSIYEEEEGMACVDNPDVGYVQLPFSVFDERMKRAGVLDKGSSITIASRSAFTQGLLFMESEQLPEYLQGLKEPLDKFHQLCQEWSLQPQEAAIGYVKAQTNIDFLVFGVDKRKQIDEIVSAFSLDLDSAFIKELEDNFSSLEKELVVPNYWKRGKA